ncbi:hypothetical protein EXIGLDRAFT_29551 [Exidia glandulosa HHB12029]|uniref:Uncharacterized protein n=1 Tax=Exidia glandulosa HHB12029 TaxID=1314781 RepID=A0A165PAM0_EXIGL|nr:hypothetical protein EXIGLDRAFT_29551 [Exidia glandulosa HHB12029]
MVFHCDNDSEIADEKPTPITTSFLLSLLLPSVPSTARDETLSRSKLYPPNSNPRLTLPFPFPPPPPFPSSAPTPARNIRLPTHKASGCSAYPFRLVPYAFRHLDRDPCPLQYLQKIHQTNTHKPQTPSMTGGEEKERRGLGYMASRRCFSRSTYWTRGRDASLGRRRVRFASRAFTCVGPSMSKPKRSTNGVRRGVHCAR